MPAHTTKMGNAWEVVRDGQPTVRVEKLVARPEDQTNPVYQGITPSQRYVDLPRDAYMQLKYEGAPAI